MEGIRKKELIRAGLAATYAAVSMVGMAVENTIQPHIVDAFSKGEHVVSQGVLYVLNHIGDVTNGFSVLPMFLAVKFAVDVLDRNSNNVLLQFISKTFPFFAVTLMMVWIFDAETIRIFPLSRLSVPDLADVPAGMFGILAGCLTYELTNLVGEKLEKDSV